MTTTNKTTTAPEQTLYMIARAQYDAAIAAHTAETKDLDWSDFDAAEALVEANHQKHQIDRLRSILIAAEEVMLDWSLAQSLKIAKPAQRQMAIDTSRKGRRMPAIREKLLDLALRLAA